MTYVGLKQSNPRVVICVFQNSDNNAKPTTDLILEVRSDAKT